MGKIIALGGGEIGRPKKTGGNYPVETTLIDKEIIKQSGKKNPKLLFIPTASNDSEQYFEIVNKHFSKLGCRVEALYLIKEKLSKNNIKNKILSSDIIYVGGGNTLKMMMVWRKLGVDRLLKKAHEKGVVLSGLSAGSICWFKFGNSDSRKFSGKSEKLIKVTGLGLIDALHCPHYDIEIERQMDLEEMMKKIPRIVSIALDNCCAIEIINGKYRIITSKKGARAHRFYWKNNKYHEEIIEQKKRFSPIEEILIK